MRIDAYNQIAQLYGVSRTTRQQRHKARLGCLIRYQFRRPVEITRLRKKQYQRLRTSGKIKSLCLRTW